MLVSCGLYQGEENAEPFGFDAAVDLVLLTHPHLDRSGRPPLLTCMAHPALGGMVAGACGDRPA